MMVIRLKIKTGCIITDPHQQVHYCSLGFIKKSKILVHSSKTVITGNLKLHCTVAFILLEKNHEMIYYY